MIKELKHELKRIIKKYTGLVEPLADDYSFVQNINLDLRKKQRRVLLLYLDYQMSSKRISEVIVQAESGAAHTNQYELFQIIKCFIDMDFIVDVCFCNDESRTELIEQYQYDVMFGLGENFRKLSSNQDCLKILYMTENPYSTSLVREKERLDYFYKRHGVRHSLYRTGMFFKENDEKIADAIVSLSGDSSLGQLNVPVKRVFPTGFLCNERYEMSHRDSRKFIVFGTDGIIHKGIDLLVEVFSNIPDCILYLCGYDVTNSLLQLGYESIPNNIVDMGYISYTSKDFLWLIQECSYCLLPSCSEGTPTGVLTLMRHGVIPIVMHGNGFDDLGDYCLFFSGYLLDEIQTTIEEAGKKSIDELTPFFEKVKTFADNNFSLEAFSSEMKKNLENIFSELGKE